MSNAIANELGDQFGVSSPSQLADHVMHCLPPGITRNGKKPIGLHMQLEVGTTVCIMTNGT